MVMAPAAKRENLSDLLPDGLLLPRFRVGGDCCGQDGDLSVRLSGFFVSPCNREPAAKFEELNSILGGGASSGCQILVI